VVKKISKMDIIIGSAGHIDHGKTSLIKALTGIDADRLPEEKSRGITIDLGFAELVLGDVKIGFVDVPGHERFVKNMLAGASGIDIVLLVVAADEGVMPQTREHFHICRLLETKKGIIVLTKTDMVDEELIEIVKLDVEELVTGSFLENSEVVCVSSKNGFGIEALKDRLKAICSDIPARNNENITRLPIDRSFSIKGFGAVVTGTLATGVLSEGSQMEVLPINKIVRIRGVQTYGNKTLNAVAGQRTAVNLGGIDHSEIERGMVLVEKNTLRPTQIIDTEIEVLSESKRSLKTRQRVRVHIGTIEALGRIQVLNESNEIIPGEKDFVQIRLELPIVTVLNERVVLRQYSPQITIAGGKVLDNSASKHRKKDVVSVRIFLTNFNEAIRNNAKPKQLKFILETAEENGLTLADLQARTAWKNEVLIEAINVNVENKTVIKADDYFLARNAFESLKAKTIKTIENFHLAEPLAEGILKETLREKLFAHLPLEIYKTTLLYLEKNDEVIAKQDVIKLKTHNLELTNEENTIRERLRKTFEDAKLEVPTLETALNQSISGTKSSREIARKVFQLLLNSSEIVKINEDFYFKQKEIEKLTEKLKSFANKSTDRMIDVSAFKELAGVSRKFAIPILEYFDREKITRRAADKRLIL
jgi:selenocysteine-specific elongation factor